MTKKTWYILESRGNFFEKWTPYNGGSAKDLMGSCMYILLHGGFKYKDAYRLVKRTETKSIKKNGLGTTTTTDTLADFKKVFTEVFGDDYD